MGYLEYHKLPPNEQTTILEAVEAKTGLPKYAVEKDWWVVRVLDIVFKTEVAGHTVFKGGTSLSKGWDLIHRFSEDIDLALDRSFLGFDEEKPSRKQITKLRKASKAFILEVFTPQLISGFENAELEGVVINVRETAESDQDPLIIEIYYPNVTEYSEYIQPRVLLEIGIRSLIEPYTSKEIKSELAKEFEDRPFADEPISIPTVNPERTFLEKLFLLHEEFQRPEEKMRVDRLSRHLYDIHQIAQTEFAEKALSDKMLYEGIVQHRSTFSRLGGVDYSSHFPPNLSPIPPEKVIDAWRNDYTTMQQQMIYGESPSFKELIGSVNDLVSRINAN